jgi:hypothetical protein
MEVVNWNLIRHPMNWVILFLMVFIAGISINLILKYNGVAPAKQS